MRALRFGCARLLAAAIVIWALAAGDVRAQSDAELKAANDRIFALYRAGKYAEATPLAERAAGAGRAGPRTRQSPFRRRPRHARHRLSCPGSLRRRRAPLQARARRVRESARPRQPQRRSTAQRAGAALHSPGQARRCRAALPAGARHQREGATAPTTRRSRPPSTISPPSIARKADTASPSSCASAPSPSSRRPRVPTTRRSPSRSTTLPCSTRRRAASSLPGR